MSVNLPERTKRESTRNRTLHSFAKVKGGNAHSEDPDPGLQSWVQACRDSKSSEECSVELAIDLIHGKWKTRILSRLQHGPARLGELRRTFPQASKKMLAQHLREMERDGLVTRKDLSNKVLHVEYSLSDSGGLAVVRLINMLRDWSMEYLPFSAGLQEKDRRKV